MAAQIVNLLLVLLLYIVLCQLNEVPIKSAVYCRSTNSDLLKRSLQSHPKSTSHHRGAYLEPDAASTFKLSHIPQRFSRPIDGGGGGDSHQYLPTGPPPYRPASLMMAPLVRRKLQALPVLKLKMQQRKIYYTFLDVMRTLHRLADQMARGQLKATGAKWHLLQSLLGKLTLLGGKSWLNQLKWPLVMLNPHFLKELLANPTFLVMLFHAIEVGYMSSSSSSSSSSVWLKPLVKLVKQPSPEKEEQTWWRRKRLYETFNGIGSSELQPNLRTAHFRRPGPPIRASALAAFAQQLLPNFYDKKLLEPPKYKQPAQLEYTDEHNHHDDEQASGHQASGDEEVADELFAPTSIEQQQQQQQLLSQEEFDNLDESEKERIIREAKRNFEESLWTNELIEQQNSFVESLKTRQLDDPSPSHVLAAAARQGSHLGQQYHQLYRD